MSTNKLSTRLNILHHKWPNPWATSPFGHDIIMSIGSAANIWSLALPGSLMASELSEKSFFASCQVLSSFFIVTSQISTILSKFSSCCSHPHSTNDSTSSVLVTQSRPTLWDPMDCSLPGSSGHRILQARILEWVAIFFCRGSSQPRDQTRVSCIAGRLLTVWATRETPYDQAFLKYILWVISIQWYTLNVKVK